MWPPILEDLKNDASIPGEEIEDDEALQRRLDAVVGFVQRVRKDLFEVGDDGLLVEPVVFTAEGEQRESASIVLGTLMLAGRLFARRRSPDAVLWMAETGTTKLPFDDDDIARLLRIGRHQRYLLG